MNKQTKTTIRVSFIGKIWMPATTCASSLTLGDSDNERFTEPYDLSNDAECLEMVEHCLGTRTGDFQSVTDFEATIERKISKTTIRDGKAILVTKSEFTTLKAWSNEESELTHCDCTRPYEVEA